MKSFATFLTEGGHDYVLHMPTADAREVSANWEKQKERDRDYNGHRDGYSGDSQTFAGKVDHHLHVEPLADRNAADDYILDKHEKWDGPIAVRYKEGDKVHTAIGGWAAS